MCCLWMYEKSEVKWHGRGGRNDNVMERVVGSDENAGG